MGGESRTYTAAGWSHLALVPMAFTISILSMITGVWRLESLSRRTWNVEDHRIVAWTKIGFLAPVFLLVGLGHLWTLRRLKYILNDDGITATEGQVHLPWEGAKLVVPQNRFWSMESTQHHTLIGADGREIVIRRTFKDFDKLIADISARVPVE